MRGGGWRASYSWAGEEGSAGVDDGGAPTGAEA